MKLEVELFTGASCGICHVIKPKIEAMLKPYETVQFKVVEVENDREYSAQNRVFTVPVLLIKVEGKEFDRFIHSFSVVEVETKIKELLARLK